MHSHLHVVQHRHIGEQADVLEGPGNAQLGDLEGAHALGVDSVDQHGTPGGLVNTGKQVENGGFARAVGADQATDLRGAQGNAEAVHGGQTAEINAQVAHIQHQGLACVGFPVGIEGWHLNGILRIEIAHCACASFCFSFLNIQRILSITTEFSSFILGDQVKSITRISTTA